MNASAGSRRSASEAADGEGTCPAKKQRLENGAARSSQEEAMEDVVVASAATGQNGSIERSRAMALGEVTEADTAVKVSNPH